MKKLFAILISLCVIFLSSCTDGTSKTTFNELSKTSTQPESETLSETTQKEIYSDDLVPMSFVEVQDMSSLKEMFQMLRQKIIQIKKKLSILKMCL